MEKFYFEVPGIGRKQDAIEFIQEFYAHQSDINGTGALIVMSTTMMGGLRNWREITCRYQARSGCRRGHIFWSVSQTSASLA